MAQAKTKSEQETASRHVDWKTRKVAALAEKLALATLKFEMIKVSANKIITFNLDEALRHDGYTATYLEYTYARLQSLLKKSGERYLTAATKVLTAPREINLLLKMAKYPEAISHAQLNYDPSEVARYLFELAQLLNDYYHEIPVLKAESTVRKARLRLLAAAAQILENGLGILGIEALKEI